MKLAHFVTGVMQADSPISIRLRFSEWTPTDQIRMDSSGSVFSHGHPSEATQTKESGHQDIRTELSGDQQGAVLKVHSQCLSGGSGAQSSIPELRSSQRWMLHFSEAVVVEDSSTLRPGNLLLLLHHEYLQYVRRWRESSMWFSRCCAGEESQSELCDCSIYAVDTLTRAQQQKYTHPHEIKKGMKTITNFKETAESPPSDAKIFASYVYNDAEHSFMR